jgi:hypothetical protein
MEVALPVAWVLNPSGSALLLQTAALQKSATMLTWCYEALEALRRKGGSKPSQVCRFDKIVTSVTYMLFKYPQT